MFNKIELSNGLNIITEKIPFVNSIAFGIWVKSGSRNESLDNNGISHFTEHMFFKGTENRNAKSIAIEMDTLGGHINAFTSKEYTCYYIVTLNSHFDKALDIFADMFFNSKFATEDIEKELNVIKEEINMYEDNSEELVHDLLQATVWQDDSLGLNIIGNKDSISKFEKDDFSIYSKNNYHPKNTIISVAGNITDGTIKNIEKYFSNFKRDEDYLEPKFNTIYKPGIITKEKNTSQAHITLGFPGIAIDDEKSYDLSVLNIIFGSGMSSRLFQKIREQHALVYSIYSYASSFMGTGLYSIYAGLRAEQIELVTKLIINEINNLSLEKITEEQVRVTKEQLKSNYLLGSESTSARMTALGKSNLFLGKTMTPEDVLEKIEQVNLERIYELIEKIFNLEEMSVAVVGNLKTINISEMIANAR